MIDRQALLKDLQTVLKRLESDLLERGDSQGVPDVCATLRAEFERAKAADRTAQSYQEWLSDAITQHAAAWVLSCVFVRFLEDNRLVDPPKIAGPVSLVIGHSSLGVGTQAENRLARARDEHEMYFRAHPTLTDRDYLLSIFDEYSRLPGCQDLFGGSHSSLVIGHSSLVIGEHPNDKGQMTNDTPPNDKGQMTNDQVHWLSGDAAGELLRFFQKIDANTGVLIHDFTDPEWDSRFLGDLYQDLSEATRKKYALLQTPEFVEEFILDRTLEPAIDEFGLGTSSGESGQRSAVSSQRRDPAESCSLTADRFRIIDPACGSGHFLLGSFWRILARWQRVDPSGKVRDLVQRTLDSIHGVDLNPYAVAVARFRLLLAAMRACGISRLADAPAFHLNLVCGDSLLHGSPGGDQLGWGWRDVDHVYRAEDLPGLRRILKPGHYHAVVANPPYITPKDSALNQEYRQRYSACHRQYSLAVPFMQRILDLAVSGGYTGQITANSFMKREFGKKLIEQYFPTVDLTHVIDTSGAYIPGHGTPTVILFGRHRQPVTDTLRTVMGIRGEPSTPDDPAKGLVWSAIVQQIDQAGSQSEFVSVGDSARQLFEKHPWSIGGGGAAELKGQLDNGCGCILGDEIEVIGRTTHTGEDDAFYATGSSLRTMGLRSLSVPLVVGEDVRDYVCVPSLCSIFPYDHETADVLESLPVRLGRHFWRFRTSLRDRQDYGEKIEARGLRWYEHSMFFPERYRTPLSIVFAFVATHNHFALDRGGKVFKQSAPVIKLPPDATEDDHLGLLGLLNSSTACFWMKQVFHDKGSTVDSHGARQTTVAFENFREFTGTGLLKFPLAPKRPVNIAKRLDDLARSLQEYLPQAVLRSVVPTAGDLASGRATANLALQQMVALQEELDWNSYRLYGLIGEDLMLLEPPPIRPGQRAFEILLARRMATGQTQTTWFERHGSTPTTEIPAEWPEDYRQLVERRIALIESDPNIRLIEQPEYKRRWNTESWESQLERALRKWLLDRLESYFDFDGRMREASPRRHGEHAEGKAPSVSSVPPWCSPPLADRAVVSTHQLADIARQDEQFQQVGELYRDDPAFDVAKLVTELVEAESVPLLPILRYKPSGLRKRKEWEDTWELQRQEDRLSDQLSAISDQLKEVRDDAERNWLKAEQERLTADRCSLTASIPIPPKYTSADFLAGPHWRLRGKLDVPKERWVSFPHCEGEDGALVIAWAGYDHLQLARAVSGYYVDIQEKTGGRDDPRLVPLLACLLELLPWVKQWHNDIDPEFQTRMGDSFEGFVQEEAKQLGKTLAEIRAWEPEKKKGARKRK